MKTIKDGTIPIVHVERVIGQPRQNGRGGTTDTGSFHLDHDGALKMAARLTEAARVADRVDVVLDLRGKGAFQVQVVGQ
jgi:hypothetical protein